MSKKTNEASSASSVKAPCPTCNAERNCYIHGHTRKTWKFVEEWMSGGTDYSLLECGGCETVFLLKDEWDSESYSHYYDQNGHEQIEADRRKSTLPSPASQIRPHWLDDIKNTDHQLHKILREAYTAYENQAYILTVVGLRTTFDRATEVLNIDPAISFERKLSTLQYDGWVGNSERDILKVIIDAGNAAAHRAWSPKKDHTRMLMTAMEAFLHRAFIVGSDALTIKAEIPPKAPRKKA